MNWQEIELSISESTDQDFKVLKSRSVAGGSINSAFVLEGKSKSYFVKFNAKNLSEMFSAEAEGLIELAKPAVIHVPAPISWGESSTHAFIVMENISLSSGGKTSAEKFGKALAALHQTHEKEFGWHRDNTIGSTSQINTEAHLNAKSKAISTKTSWVNFYRTHRLQYQISLAVKNGCGRELKLIGEQLCQNLEVFFESYNPKPSLLHGDLWSGNYGYDEKGEPVIFDPAVYFGDRETDIAMTELFGGFSADFYDAYNEVYPLNAGYRVRKNLYNLYHILNHYNLFGGSYQQQSVAMMKDLLSETL